MVHCFVIHDTINANMVYKIVNIKNVSSATANVKIRRIENTIPAIFIGQFINVSNIIDNIIIAIGRAKYNSNILLIVFSFLFV